MSVSPTVRINVSGARGESLADVARRVGTIAGIPVPPDATDADVLNLLSDGIADVVAAAGYTVLEFVRVATTANITLSGTQTIDGVAVVAGNRVLVKNQTTAANNGIYVAAAGAWTRSTDFDEASEVKQGAYVTVLEGATMAGAWVLTTADPITVGVTAQVWLPFYRLANYVTKSGAETLFNKTFAGATKFATNGSRIGITNDAAAITPSALVEIANNGAVTCGLRVSSRWSGTTALPYQNNDDSLWETFNQIISDSANYSWSISAPNAYNDIPAGVHDSGERVGVYGWATSVNVPGYTHAGRLTSQIGVRGRAGFQSDIVQSPATASIDIAIGIKGEVRHDSPLATIHTAKAGDFTCVDQGGIILNNYGVYSEVTLGVETNWSFYGAAGEFYNRDRGYFGDGSVSGRQSNCAITARGSVNSLEFGNADPGGYGSNLGATAASGLPFLAFCAEAEATGNTFRTRGKVGTVLRNGLDGSLVFARVVNANATGQSPTDDVILRPNGKMLFLRNPRVLSAPPASASASGEVGEIAWDDGFFYVCVADDTWKRAALATW